MSAVLFAFAMIDNILLLFINIYNVSRMRSRRKLICKKKNIKLLSVDYYTIRSWSWSNQSKRIL